ncbi:MAG: hypothetical protein Fur005_39840 [Roseiflexaceae bacterium]
MNPDEIERFLDLLATTQHDGTITCNEALDMMPAYATRELQDLDPAQQYPALALHLQVCEYCTAEYAELIAILTTPAEELPSLAELGLAERPMLQLQPEDVVRPATSSIVDPLVEWGQNQLPQWWPQASQLRPLWIARVRHSTPLVQGSEATWQLRRDFQIDGENFTLNMRIERTRQGGFVIDGRFDPAPRTLRQLELRLYQIGHTPHPTIQAVRRLSIGFKGRLEIDDLAAESYMLVLIAPSGSIALFFLDGEVWKMIP